MSKTYNYKTTIKWTGNTGTGTEVYSKYERSHTISIEHKVDILGSSDPELHGDITKHNPEELLLSAASACHMMWYLRLCSQAGIIVTDYIDNATGIMVQSTEGGGKFTEATLNPIITITDSKMSEKAIELHTTANDLCFIANSLSFPIKHNPTIKIAE